MINRRYTSLFQILAAFLLSLLFYACKKDNNGQINPFTVVFTKENLFSDPGRTEKIAFSILNDSPLCTTVFGAVEFPTFKDLSSTCYLFFSNLTTKTIISTSFAEILPPLLCDQSLTSSTTYQTSDTVCDANNIYQLTITCMYLNKGSFTDVSPELTCTPL